MGRCLRAAAVFGVMRHEALTHRGGDARQPRRHGRRRARGGRQTRRGRRPDREGEHACGLTVRHIPARRLTERRSLRLPRRAECAFSSHHRPGDAGPNPPPACGALWEVPQLGKCVRATPRQAAGGLRRGPQASAWGLTARKDAVWAEGFADGTPWARPGRHQAANGGLRRCWELRVDFACR